MTKKSALFSLGLVVIVIMAVIFTTKQTSSPVQEYPSNPISTPTAINETSPETKPIPTDSDNAAGIYADYSADKLGTGKNVIFFAASWCPSCRELDRNLSSATIPAGVTILKADFDHELELRRKHGVTLQHTLVQVDAQGNQLQIWNGLYSQYSLDDILNQLV